MRVAVVGAGAAGAVLANALQQQGVAVEVFDKARGPGGRMATRRHGRHAFDHGAQYFTLRDPRLTGLTADWVKAGVIAPWSSSGSAAEPRWVAVPGMNALARHLLEPTPVHWRSTVTALARDSGAWRLYDADRRLGEGFDRVVLALPGPQVRSLLDGLGGWDGRLANVAMAPCWAVMLADFDAPPKPGPAGGEHLDDPQLAWIAHDAGKPGRAAAGDTWVLHATDAFSRRAFEQPAEHVADGLWQRFAALKGLSERPPGHLVAHRWRYARVTEPLGEACLWSAELGLGACGDWCLGPRVEAALLSGLAMADALMAPATTPQ